MQESPLFWPVRLEGNVLWVLDETLIPEKIHYIKVRNTADAVSVIRKMKTRAFGQFLVVLNTFLLVLKKNKAAPQPRLLKKLNETAKALNHSRPTFPFSEVTSIVLDWAQQAKKQKIDPVPFIEKNILGFLSGIRSQRTQRAEKIAALIEDGQSVLTHCNVSGELAMAAQICRRQHKQVRFFATETRPYLQGAKLTCWELKQVGADVTLIADNAVGTVLQKCLVDLVVVGSDRSCANGDIANKIGTYQIAVAAQEFGIPFYALTQPSRQISRGEKIPIEMRSEDELLKFSGKPIAPKGTRGFYPGFDVVSHKLIKGAIGLNAKAR